MGSWLKKVLAAAVVAVALAGPAAAQVPDPYARELAQKLARAEQSLSENGYQRAAGPFAGALAQRQSRRFPLTLRTGQEYRIVGVCDSRCGGLDFRLYDATNGLVAGALLDDSGPVLRVRPANTGLYTAEVVMDRCTSDPCFFAFNVYSN